MYILGPLSYVIYVNDIGISCQGNIISFADVTTLYISDSDIKADDTTLYISDSDIKGRCYYIIHLR